MDGLDIWKVAILAVDLDEDMILSTLFIRRIYTNGIVYILVGSKANRQQTHYKY